MAQNDDQNRTDDGSQQQQGANKGIDQQRNEQAGQQDDANRGGQGSGGNQANQAGGADRETRQDDR
jgi:hypothetical protein